MPTVEKVEAKSFELSIKYDQSIGQLITDAFRASVMGEMKINRTELYDVIKFEALDKKGRLIPRLSFYWHLKDKERIRKFDYLAMLRREKSGEECSLD
jgi:hypothetical protein